MMEEKMLKGATAGLITIGAFLSGNFTPLLYLLLFFEICDYITGMIAASHRGGVSSKGGFNGLIKKVCYFFLVAVGFGFDYMIYEFSRIMGLAIDYPAIFGILTIGYLLSTELISILENLEEIGIHVPFLTTALKVFKEKIADKGSK